MLKNKGQDSEFKEALREFDHSLPMSLLRAREAVMKEFIPALRANDLSPEQWRVIRALEQQNGLELSDISKRCYLLAPSLSRIAQNLQKRNLVERRSVASDQRRSELFLTKEGHQLFQKIAPESNMKYAKITEKFGHQKLELLYQLLDDLVESLDNKENTTQDKL